MWDEFMESAGREVNPGVIAGLVGLVTGLPSMTWAAIQGDWLPAYAGSATGIGGVLYFIFKQGEDRRIKMLSEAIASMTTEIAGQRAELKAVRETAEDADQKAIEERRKLRIENEDLRVQLSRVGAGVQRVENIVSNPLLPTPNPDIDPTRVH